MTKDFQSDRPLEEGIAFKEQSDHRECAAILTAPGEEFVIDQASEIPCDLCVWTGGFVASSLAREAGLAVKCTPEQHR
jgi:hypothetical protein